MVFTIEFIQWVKVFQAKEIGLWPQSQGGELRGGIHKGARGNLIKTASMVPLEQENGNYTLL